MKVGDRVYNSELEEYAIIDYFNGDVLGVKIDTGDIVEWSVDVVTVVTALGKVWNALKWFWYEVIKG